MPSRQHYEDSPERGSDSGRLLFAAESDTASIEEGNFKEWSAANMLGPPPSPLKRLTSFIHTHWKLITTILLLSIVLLQLFILNAISAAAAAAETACVQVGGDYTGQAPVFDTKITQWAADYEFVPLNASAFLAPQVQAKWEANYPVGSGFPEDGLVYNSTSVTHQLHCVYIMGKIFASVMVGREKENMPEGDGYEEHFLHCVDYMRQAAMCSADVTVEPRGEDGGKGPVALYNAFRGKHVCKDYKGVKDYLEQEVREGRRNILPLDD